MNLLFLDTETTDLSGNARLIQLAYKNLKTGKIVNEYFKPPVPISFGAMSVHHVTEKMVADKPMFLESEHKDILLDELKENILVAHNAPFDIGILNNEGVEVANSIDTCRLAKHLISEAEQHKLQYLRYYLGLDVEASAHEAGGDIAVLEALFFYLKDLVAKKFGLENDDEILQKMKELDQAPALMNSFYFGKHKGRTFADVAKTDKGYLEWLYSSETQKSPAEQKQELLSTLKYYLGK